jgi:hypothetical protein
VWTGLAEGREIWIPRPQGASTPPAPVWVAGTGMGMRGIGYQA